MGTPYKICIGIPYGDFLIWRRETVPEADGDEIGTSGTGTWPGIAPWSCDPLLGICWRILLGTLYGNSVWVSAMPLLHGAPLRGFSMGIPFGVSMGVRYGSPQCGSSLRILYGRPLCGIFVGDAPWESSVGIFYGESDPLWGFAEGPSWEYSMGILGAPLRGFSTGILFGDPLWGPSMRIRYGVLYGDPLCALFYGDP